METVEIDGSQGEGGGQIIRTGLALAALLGKHVKVTKIRAARPKPGLKPQHLASIQTLATVCNAKLDGVRKDSEEITFSPSKIGSSSMTVKIGTAGSISLLIQQLLPVSFKSDLKIRVTGGTNVSWSPPIEFMQHLLFPLLRKMNARLSLSTAKRGYYPRGGGIVNFSSKKAKFPLKPLHLDAFSKPEEVMVFSHSSSLPGEVSVNQASSAKSFIRKQFPGICFAEKVESAEKSNTIGSGITLIALDTEGNMVSGSSLGKRGKPAETVGREAAERLVSNIAAGKAVDFHTADQLIPFMALAKGLSTIHCSKLSQHTLTNISVCEQLLGVKFDVKGKAGEPAEIFVEGAGFT